MKIAILGAGFTGLSAAYTLSKQDHQITVFEKDEIPGGLALGFKEKNWDWSLEKHYHHWFTNDHAVLRLAKEIGQNVIIKTPQTNWYVQNKIYQFASVKAALTFPLLTPLERIRQLCTLGMLRFNPFWRLLEGFKTNEVMPKLMGKKAYTLLWESILFNKFGNFAKDISLAWFWARIKKRTQSLTYPEGGFLQFAKRLSQTIENSGGTILFKAEIQKIIQEKEGVSVISKRNGKEVSEKFDRVIVTLPSFLFLKIAPDLPQSYKGNLLRLKGLGATNLVLRLKKPFFSDNTYWLSVADTKSPVMAIVEHTNFMDSSHYGEEHIVYLGNYLSHDDPRFALTADETLTLFDPFLKKINPEYNKGLIGYTLFKAPFAQPIIPIQYSQIIPPFKTPLKNVFLANIQQVYPWDRGTNYAVELGQKIAKIVLYNEEQS